jgi:hypothetical protein
MSFNPMKKNFIIIAAEKKILPSSKSTRNGGTG